ncbi:uncharacterized protein LOC143284991 isoform X2 [Babylonia areolata]
MVEKATNMAPCHDKLTDRNFALETDEKRTHHIPQLSPTFFYADLEQDNIEEILDNSIPELDSMC